MGCPQLQLKAAEPSSTNYVTCEMNAKTDAKTNAKMIADKDENGEERFWCLTRVIDSRRHAGMAKSIVFHVWRMAFDLRRKAEQNTPAKNLKAGPLYAPFERCAAPFLRDKQWRIFLGGLLMHWIRHIRGANGTTPETGRRGL